MVFSYSYAHLEFLSDELKNKNFRELQQKRLRSYRILDNGADHLKIQLGDASKQNEEEFKKLHIFGIKPNTNEGDIQQLLKNFTGIKIKMFPLEP